MNGGNAPRLQGSCLLQHPAGKWVLQPSCCAQELHPLLSSSELIISLGGKHNSVSAAFEKVRLAVVGLSGFFPFVV